MSTRKSLAWSFSQQFSQMGLQFIGSIVIARLLTPDEVGVFALAMAASALISSLRELGVGSYLIREEELNRDKIRTAFGILLAVSWTLGFIIFLIREPMEVLYDTPGIANVMVLLSVSFFITPFGGPAQSLLRRDMRFDILHHIMLVSTLTGTVISITLAALSFSYMALAWGLIAEGIVRTVLLMAVRPDHLKLLPGFRYWQDVVHFGGYITGTSLVSTINTEGVKFVLGGVITPGAIALYERGLQLPMALRQAIMRPLGRVLFPTFSKEVRENRPIAENYYKVLDHTNILVWPALFSVGFFSEPIVVFLFGENWRTAGQIMPYLVIARIFLLSVPNAQPVLMSTGHVRRLFAFSSVMMVLNLVVTATTAVFGLYIFAVFSSVRGAVSAALWFLAVRKIAGLEVGRMARIHGKALAMAVFASLPAASMRLGYGDDVPFSMMLLAAIMNVGLWFLALLLTKHELLKEIKTLIQRFRASNKSLGYG